MQLATQHPLSRRSFKAAYLPLQELPADLPRDISSRLGRRVRQLRQHHRMTQQEVAVKFGVDRTYLSDLERGRKSISLPTLEVLALGFRLSLSDLLQDL